MLLSDRGIAEAMYQKSLTIEPLLEPIQPASIELHLGEEILLRQRVILRPNEILDPRIPPNQDSYLALTRYSNTNGEDYVLLLEQGRIYLATTIEAVGFGNTLAGKVEGKSSLGRLGLQIENAGFIDPGFRGQITLELVNMSGSSFRLYPGMRIAQLLIYQLDQPTRRSYGDTTLRSRYQDQRGTTPAKGEDTPPSPQRRRSKRLE